MEKKKNIFICVLPDTGHINPLLGIAKKLIDLNYEVTFYGRITQKDLIEKSGSIFKKYKAFRDEMSRIPSVLNEPKLNMLSFFEYLIDVTYLELQSLIDDILNEKPELIIYDHFSLPVRLTLKVMESQYSRGLIEWKPKRLVKVFTCFASLKNVYPLEKNETLVEDGLIGLYYKFRLFIKQTIFSIRFKINIYNTKDFIYYKNENLNIVTIFPELQPMFDRFDSSFKFVGNCVSDETRKIQIENLELIKILNLFEPLNPKLKSNDLKLIYCSLGTLFNRNLFIFDSVIEAVKSLNEGFNNIKLVLGVGKDSHEEYKRRIREENYDLTENIVLVDFAPQIDLLKRADLFITHCGMNSASEAIHYGVPIIGVPITVDQPLVCDRLVNQLKLGVRLKPMDINSILFKQAILEIFNNQDYLKNSMEYSKISRKYDGCANASNLLINYLN